MDIVFFAHTATLAALAVVAAQQILKLKFIPVSFANKYPVPTNILLSIVSSVIVTWQTSIQPHAWTDWLLLAATISVVAGVVYNTLLRNWSELRSTEGPADAK